MKKKTKTKSTTNETFNTTQSGTMRPVNPEFVNTGIQNLAGKIDTTFGGIDPKTFVAGPNDLMQQGAGALSQLGGGNSSMAMGQGFLQDAGSAGPQTIEAVNIKDYLSDFMNPFMKDVVDTSLADFDAGAGMTRAQNKLALAGDQTFGGSSGALQTALGEGELARGRAATSAALRSRGFDTALGGATSQAGLEASRRSANAGLAEQALARRMGAGTALGQLGATQDANARANAGAQFDMGEALRGVTNAQTRAPLDLLLGQIGAFGGLPLDLLRGQDTTGTSSGTSNGTQTQTTTKSGGIGDLLKAAALTLGTGGLGSLAMLLPGAAAGTTAGMGAIVSDRRAKTDIKRVGKLDDGTKVYAYRYKAGGPRHIGVMAQEVAKTKPEAVVNLGDLLAVDYGKL